MTDFYRRFFSKVLILECARSFSSHSVIFSDYLKTRPLAPKSFSIPGGEVEIGVVGDLSSDGGVVGKALN
ncbi:MAG TPA: hypothetical protein PL048_16390, partial [Leptospiraceae bacterium]|nr:hypothetical protein [Leptospiraceae bacterium]